MRNYVSEYLKEIECYLEKICNEQQAMMDKAARMMVEEGLEPPIINSINIEGGLEKKTGPLRQIPPLNPLALGEEF